MEFNKMRKLNERLKLNQEKKLIKSTLEETKQEEPPKQTTKSLPPKIT